MKRVQVEIATVHKRYVNSDMTLVERYVGEPIVLAVEVGDDATLADARERLRQILQKLVDEP